MSDTTKIEWRIRPTLLITAKTSSTGRLIVVLISALAMTRSSNLFGGRGWGSCALTTLAVIHPHLSGGDGRGDR